ncbi:Butyrophilin subfamily 2 member A2 Precursor [Channa argus]|uniref:Butyrophilin subfamily 2 member A2 n=1 Tax=Channa argus TaxID=215402 RepID=A0A6G1Q667_CHAAH|nr:Butyrophilin subfamily 2 member A2 Precursor [Channa argus]
MVHVKDRLVVRSLFRCLSGLVFQHVVLLLTHFNGAQLQKTGPPEPIKVMVGDDTVLPCHLEPPMDAVQMTIEWGRPDLNPRFAYVWHNGQELLGDQNIAYKGRTALSVSKLKQGDVSLRLSKVKVSDNGSYRCYIPRQTKEYFVELVVGAVSAAGISLAGLDKSSSGVVLQCESKGWYPEPEVLWLDGEGNVLSAGPTETVRGPDDLYTVSSRVTVDKRHGHRFTCRVQQNIINQTRETHIDVPADFFMTSSNCSASVTISVLFGLMLIFAVVFFVWKLRQNKTGSMSETSAQNTDKENESRDQLMTKSKNLGYLDKKKAKLDEDFQRKKEEQKHMEQTLRTLTELREELEKQNEKLKAEKEKLGTLAEEYEKKMNSVDEEVNKKEGDKMDNKVQGYLKLKQVFTEIKWKLEERKKEPQTLQLITEKLMKGTFDEIKRITERKEEVEKHMEQIKEQLEETEKQREEIQAKHKSVREEKKSDFNNLII